MDERLEFIIDVQAKGVRATEKDIENATAALKSLNAEGEVSSHAFRDFSAVLTTLSEQLALQESKAKSGAGQWEAFRKTLEENRKAADDFASAQERIQKASGQVEQARFDRGFEEQLQGLSKVEQAQHRVAQATIEYNRALKERTDAFGTGDLDRQEQALQRQAKALQNLGKEERNLAQQQTAASEQREQAAQKEEEARERLQKQVAEAEKKQADAQSKLDLNRQVQDLKQVEAAQTKLTAAQEKYARSSEEVARAQRSGDSNAQISALRDQEKATRELISAENDLANAQQESQRVQDSLRYANYDLGRSMFAISGGITAAGVGIVAASAQYESAFTRVERTSGVAGQAVEDLKDDFIALAREMPVTFDDLTELGARGAQLGIAADDLAQFTEVVAQFVATSDTVSLDQAVEAFGRISNLLGEKDFNRLGSAITLVGVNAAATESQIIRTTQELAPFAASVGMTSAEVIGLASTMASLGRAPEQARSAFAKLQSVMDMAVAGMNDNLGAFASLLNQTEDEVAQLWKTDPGEFIRSMARALAASDDLVVTLDALGLSEKRVEQVFKALANDAANAGSSMSVLERGMADANQGFEEGTELQRQYSLILDDLSSKWQILKNSLMELVAVLGDEFAPIAKIVIDFVTQMVQGLTDFAATDVGGTILRIAGVLATLVAAYTAVRGAIALATGAVIGFNRVAAFTGGPGIIAGLSTLSKQFLVLAESTGTSSLAMGANATAQGVVTGASGVTAGALTVLRAALTRLLAATGVGAVLVLLGNIIVDLRGSALTAIDAIEWLGETFGEANSPVGFLVSSFYGLVQALSDMAGGTAQATDIVAHGFSQVAAVFAKIGEVIPLVFTFIQVTIKNGVQRIGNFLKALGMAFMAVPVAIYNALEPVRDFLDPFFNWVVEKIQGFMSWLQDALAPISRFIGSFASGFSQGSKVFSDGFKTAMGSARDWAQTLPSMLDGLDNLGGALETGGGAIRDFNEDLNDTPPALDTASNSLNNFGDTIRTVKDYANDLQSVFSRAFEIRFSAGSTRDAITSTFIQMREASEAAARSIRALKADIQGIQNDIKTQQYFLSIAVEYGDTARAEAIQANLAKLQSNLADTQAKLTEEQAKNSKELTGNSKAAIENRKQMEDLVKKYQDHIVALAASGMGSAELARETEKLRKDFVKQATQLGFNQAEVKKYDRAFKDMGETIRKMPRNVTVEIKGLSPAQAALKEFMSKAKKQIGSGLKIPFKATFDDSALNKAARGASLTAQMNRLMTELRSYNVGTPQYSTINNQIKNIADKLASGNYAEGGFTGRGGKYELAGAVHRGEYVIPQRDVNQRTGLPYADALGRLMAGAPGGSVSRPVSRSTASSQAGHIASFGPMAEQQLRHALQQIVSLDGKTIANSSSSTYAQQTRVGAA